jgi:hypothetical protein
VFCSAGEYSIEVRNDAASYRTPFSCCRTYLKVGPTARACLQTSGTLAYPTPTSNGVDEPEQEDGAEKRREERPEDTIASNSEEAKDSPADQTPDDTYEMFPRMPNLSPWIKRSASAPARPPTTIQTIHAQSVPKTLAMTSASTIFFLPLSDLYSLEASWVFRWRVISPDSLPSETYRAYHTGMN